MLAATLDRFGRVDILVNNAGVGTPEAAESETHERFAEVLDVNLTAAFAVSQLVGRTMLEAGTGTIVNVVSILGIVSAGQIPFPSYAASKGGLIALTRELAGEWSRRGVRVARPIRLSACMGSKRCGACVSACPDAQALIDDRLDHYASEALAQWRFQPATRNGDPVDVEAVFRIPFRPARVKSDF